MLDQWVVEERPHKLLTHLLRDRIGMIKNISQKDSALLCLEKLLMGGTVALRHGSPRPDFMSLLRHAAPSALLRITLRFPLRSEAAKK